MYVLYLDGSPVPANGLPPGPPIPINIAMGNMRDTYVRYKTALSIQISEWLPADASNLVAQKLKSAVDFGKLLFRECLLHRALDKHRID